MVSPARAWFSPSCARSNAPGMPSRTSTTCLGSASASSSACARSDRARVPSWVCVRSARRRSFVACISSRLPFNRCTTDLHVTRKHTKCAALCYALDEADLLGALPQDPLADLLQVLEALDHCRDRVPCEPARLA